MNAEMKTSIVRDYMSKPVVTCEPTSTLIDIQNLMDENRITRVVVQGQEGKPTGIVSEKDIIDFVLRDETMRGLDEIRANEVASSNLYSISSTASVEEAAEVMIRRRISSLVVTNNELEGILTKADVVTYMALAGSPCVTREFMSPNPITVKCTQPIFAAIVLIRQHGISRVIVTDRENKPIGIITIADIALASHLTNLSRLYVAGGPDLAAKLLKRSMVIRRITTEDFMTPQPLCLNSDSTLSVAAKLMSMHRISGIPVVDTIGRLEGIISKSDITQAVAHGRALYRSDSSDALSEPNTHAPESTNPLISEL
jgi:CBS domain-containing protein